MIPRFFLIGIWSLFGWGCAPNLYWVHESSSMPSCQPDSLPQWSDFMPRIPNDERGAETAFTFHLDPSKRKLRISFDHAHSWVKPNLIDPKNAVLKKTSDRLLAHEQVHFLLSCLVVRQANMSLTEKDDLLTMLELVKLMAQRLNLQYDAATRHGQNLKMQQLWEAEVMRQFQNLRVSQVDQPENEYF